MNGQSETRKRMTPETWFFLAALTAAVFPQYDPIDDEPLKVAELISTVRLVAKA